MAKKDKSNETENTQFELQKTTPIFKPNGERDYFAEYYSAYRNDYIDQYLKAYRELKDVNAAIDNVDKKNDTHTKKDK